MTGSGPAGEVTYDDIRARLARVMARLAAHPDQAARAVAESKPDDDK